MSCRASRPVAPTNPIPSSCRVPPPPASPPCGHSRSAQPADGSVCSAQTSSAALRPPQARSAPPESAPLPALPDCSTDACLAPPLSPDAAPADAANARSPSTDSPPPQSLTPCSSARAHPSNSKASAPAPARQSPPQPAKLPCPHRQTPPPVSRLHSHFYTKRSVSAPQQQAGWRQPSGRRARAEGARSRAATVSTRGEILNRGNDGTQNHVGHPLFNRSVFTDVSPAGRILAYGISWNC